MAINVIGTDVDPFVALSKASSKAQPVKLPPHSSFIDLEQERVEKAMSNVQEPVYVNRNTDWANKEVSDYNTRDAEHNSYIVTGSLPATGTESFSHSEELHYYNNSDTDFYITSNNGICRSIKGNGVFSKDKNTLIIKRVYIFANLEAVKFTLDEFIRYVKVTGNKATESARIIHKTLLDFYSHKKDSYGKYISNRISVSIDYMFDTRSISENGIYIPDIDIVMSPNSNAVHPRDFNFKTIEKMSNMTEEYGVTGIVVEMVDNERKYDPKYIYVAGQVQSVAPTLNLAKESGITILRTNTDKAGKVKSERVSFMSIDEALEKGIIHDTYESAITNGDPGKLMQQALEDKRHMSQINKFDIERDASVQKLQYEQKLAEMKADHLKAEQAFKFEQMQTEQEHKRAIASFEQETKRRMAEFEQDQKEWENKLRRRSMAMSDEYEQRSYNRKDVSDSAKTIPTVITAVAGTLAAVFAISKLS